MSAQRTVAERDNAERGAVASRLLPSVILSEPEWQPREQAHRARVEPWIAGRRARRTRGERHAVEDFVFDYYPYSLAKIAAWHPGLGVGLRGASAARWLDHADYVRVPVSDGDSVVLADPARLERRRARLDLARRLLAGTASRPAVHGCFGMHEWAMVYRIPASEIRHETTPLRLSPDEIADVVDEVGLRCTHIDAFRFFTPDAVPLNAPTPTRQTQPDVEQPGCLHANMDLYKVAMWMSPYIASELVADCLALAVSAREVDMQASPYDVRHLGLAPIEVETADGRRRYVAEQQRIAAAAAPLRDRLLGEADRLLDALAAG